MAEYISLQEAARLCSYSQEYLSLRARQGKLKALKLGRNWVCTKEWLQEYISQSGKPGFKQEKARLRVADPPRNLPIYAPDAEIWEDEIPDDIARQKEFQRKFQFAFATGLVAALLLAAVFQGHQGIFTVTGKASEEIISFAASLQDIVQEKGFAIVSEVQTWQTASVGEIAKNYFAWLGEQVRNIIKAH